MSIRRTFAALMVSAIVSVKSRVAAGSPMQRIMEPMAANAASRTSGSGSDAT